MIKIKPFDERIEYKPDGMVLMVEGVGTNIDRPRKKKWWFITLWLFYRPTGNPVSTNLKAILKTAAQQMRG